jgi:hypothetical protein
VVKAELEGARRVLRRAGVATRYKTTASGNAFMVKVWLCVLRAADVERATAMMEVYLKEVERETRLIHDAT